MDRFQTALNQSKSLSGFIIPKKTVDINVNNSSNVRFLSPIVDENEINHLFKSIQENPNTFFGGANSKFGYDLVSIQEVKNRKLEIEFK